MKILKEAPDNGRMQELKRAMAAANDRYKAASKEAQKFRWDLVDRGYWKHNQDPSAWSEWEQVKELTPEDRQKLKDLEAKENAAWHDYLDAVDDVRNPEKEAEAEKRKAGMLRRASKYGVAPEDAQKFERLKRDINEAKRNRDYHERMFNQAKRYVSKSYNYKRNEILSSRLDT